MSAVRLLRKMDPPELSEAAKERTWREIERSMNLAMATSTAASAKGAIPSAVPPAKGLLVAGASKAVVLAGLTSVVVATVVSVAVVRSSFSVIRTPVTAHPPALVASNAGGGGISLARSIPGDSVGPLEPLPPPMSTATPRPLPPRALLPTIRSGPGTLAEEVRLLAKARAAIEARDPDSALTTLSQFRRVIPRPQLQPEAERLEAQARLLQK